MDVEDTPAPAKPSISKDVSQRDPPAVRAVLLSAWFAWMSWTLTWAVNPVAWMQWTPTAKVEMALWVGLLVIIGGLWASVRMGRRIDRISTLLLTAHALVSVLATLVWSDRSLPFTLASVGVLVVLPAVFLFSTHRQDRTALRPFLELACIAILLPALLLFAWSPVSIAIVRYQALSVAAGDPFCIQVPVDHLGRARQASNWMQLSGLRMQTLWTNGKGSSDYQFPFHAVLIVERDGIDEFHNWSYRSQSFRPVDRGAMTGLHIHRQCQPDTSFFEGLEWAGTWTPFVPPMVAPLLTQLEEIPPMPETIDRASEWEMDFWTQMFVRYASMRALIEACDVVVDPSVLRTIGRHEENARDRLRLTWGQARENYDKLLLALSVKGDDVCNRSNGQFQDMLASFPQGESSQR